MDIDKSTCGGYTGGMTQAVTIADKLGRTELAKAIGVGSTAISNAVIRGKFPPSWYLVVSQMCSRAGIDCPPELFQMKSTNGVSSGYNGQNCNENLEKVGNL